KAQASPSQSSQSFRILPPSMNLVKSESPSQIVPFPGCFPIQVSNRFSCLGTTVGQVRPNYQSALISNYDHFYINTQVAQSPIPLRKSSPYFPKDSTHLFIIEYVLDYIADPVTLAKHYFPPNHHFMPQCPYKSL
ncbi:unnamed protein product, partial [Prunus brigantina]